MVMQKHNFIYKSNLRVDFIALLPKNKQVLTKCIYFQSVHLLKHVFILVQLVYQSQLMLKLVKLLLKYLSLIAIGALGVV
jgi:hypothetical protein